MPLLFLGLDISLIVLYKKMACVSDGLQRMASLVFPTGFKVSVLNIRSLICKNKRKKQRNNKRLCYGARDILAVPKIIHSDQIPSVAPKLEITRPLT